MTDDLITPENNTIELLKSLYETAYMDTKIDERGYLRVQDGSTWCFVIPSMDLGRIQFVAPFGIKDGMGRLDLLESANRVNREYIMIRTTVEDDGSIFFEHDISIRGGLPKKTLILTTKRFLSIPRQAFDELSNKQSEVDSI